MADPKYANLPGIAHDQPDVFETEDLPEADKFLDFADRADFDDAVETLHLSSAEAFGRFKGKHLDASKVDFSDRLKPAKHRKGYICWSGEFGVNPPGEDETPLQKYQRLNCEVKELLEELEKATNEQGSGKSDTQKLSGVAMQVTALKDELAKLQLEEKLGSEALRDLSEPHKAASLKLMSHLQQLRSKSKDEKSSGQHAASESSTDERITYELMMKPERARLQEQERLQAIDKRLQVLEKALGATEDNMSALTVETSSKSVLGAIDVLSARSALFEPEHLEHIEGRLAALQTKMNSVAEKKEILDDQEKVHKIDELYEMVQKISAMNHVLPAVVDRLDTLQDLHEHAANFSQTLTQLDAVQERLASNLANNEALLRSLQEKFASNMENVQENFQSIEKRMGNLSK